MTRAGRRAQAIDDMVQNDPDNMQPPTERTVVKVLYDDRSVYVGVINYMQRSVEDHHRAWPARHVSAQRLDQDHVRSAPRSPDRLHLRFESLRRAGRHDVVRRHAARAPTTTRSGKCARRSPRKAGPRNSAFRFRSCASRITPGEAVVWGFNIRRDIVYNAEMIRWVATPRGAQGFVSRFGHLTFAKPPAPPRRLEVQPFTLARQEHVTATGYDRDLVRRPRLAHGPRHRDDVVGGGESGLRPGRAGSGGAQPERVRDVLSRRSGRSSSRTAASLVPNYPQVPMFHSRRIGQRPNRFAIPDGETVIERPDATTILGATKVTGKAQRLDVWRPDGADRSRIRAGRDGDRRSRPSG